MLVSLGTYADLTSMKAVLGEPNAVLYLITGSSAQVAIFYRDKFAVVANDGSAGRPNQAQVVSDFPVAVQVTGGVLIITP